jgi:hypothetical protein
VVIDDFNVCRPCIRPLKTDAQLTINPDAVLTSPVTVQCLKPVTRRGPQVSKFNSSMQHGQLSSCDIQDAFPSSRITRFKQSLGFCTPEIQDHALILNVKRYKHTTPQ